MEFKFEGRLKLVTQVLMAVGLVALVGGFLTDTSDHHNRWWANLLINGFFCILSPSDHANIESEVRRPS